MLHISRCLERSDLVLSPLMCGKEYNQINEQTDELETQSWAVIGITITNVVAVIIQGLLRCKKQATSKEREEEEEDRHKVYHYVSK